MSPNINRRLFWPAIILIVIASVLSLVLSDRIPAFDPDPLAATLQRARDAGSYRFTGEITQVTIPTSKVTNVGRSSRTEQLYLEGQTDLRAQSMQLRLWSQQGSVGDPASGVAVKLEDGKTYVQEGLGAWREQEGLADSFAPQGDFMAYLTAHRDPVVHAPEIRNGVVFTRYTFRLDGPALARYIRDLAEDTLRQRGELAPGMQTELPAYYRDMVGDGELWVGSDGLPLRQILRMRFPEQRDEQVQAEIVTNFSGFGYAGGASLLTGGIDAALLDWRDTLTSALSLLAVLAFCALLLSGRGRIWRGLALALILMLVFNPLVSDLQIAKAANAQASRLAEQEQERAESRQRDELLAQMAGPKIDPHVDPLQDSNQAVIPLPEQAFAPPPSRSAAVQMAPAVSWDDPTDTDQDGLTDFEEESIGTDPTYFDTDEDGITDTIEIQGINMGGYTWFMDPNEADSNNDGIPDTIEHDYNLDSYPDDTNVNGVPDVFDRDNDGDGVFDSKDLAPFTVLNDTFTADHPFQLTIQHLTAGEPVFVDFQIRPVNDQHLWFAYNVLDWPVYDTAGHIQDDDGGTFASVTAQNGGGASGTNDENGDLRMVPMLELRIPTGSGNLPPQEDLIPYNISINQYTEDGSQMVAYVPLSVITDEQTGARVAFSARMPYLPAGSWTEPHEARLVWLVQALNDIVCDPLDADDIALGCSADGYLHNVSQVLQSYADEWKLTGLNVKEDHGASVAIIYEDPAVDMYPKLDNSLTALSAGLDQSFLTGRDQDENGQRDIDLNELMRRFNHPTNSAVVEEERWAVPNVLRVERQDYETLDQAVMSTAMTETVRILDDRFAAPWASDPDIKPLLMYAQEAHSRALGMDVMNKGGGWVIWDGTLMTMDLYPSEQEAAPLLVTANLKWTPYCSPDGDTPRWLPCTTDEWWKTLEARHAGDLPGDPVGDVQIADGRNMIMNIYASVLMQGISSVVEVNDIIEAENNANSKNDTWLRDMVKSVLDIGVNELFLKKLANNVFMERFKEGKNFDFVKYMGKFKEAIKQVHPIEAFLKNFSYFIKYYKNIFRDFYRENKTKLAIIGIGVAVTLGILLIKVLVGNPVGEAITSTLKAVVFLVGGLMTAWSTIQSVKSFVVGARTFSGAIKILRLGSVETVFQQTKGAAMIGAIISELINWGFFIYGMIADHVQVFSQEFNQAVAETIAANIYIIIMMVLSFSIIGTIIAAILALIDGILTFLCETGIWSGLKKDGVCFTIGGTITKVLVYSLYNYASMVDATLPDLLVLGSPSLTLTQPDKGLVDSNSLRVSMPFTTTVHHRVPDPADGVLIYPYGWTFFTKDNLRSSTISATLTSPSAVDFSVSRNQMTSEWEVEKDGDRKWGLVPMFRGTAGRTAKSGEIDLAAGINRDIPVHLNFAYALPAYECWGIIVLGVCYVRTLRENSSSELNTFQFDILPSTLDGFMAMGPKGPQGSQTYGLSWDSRFMALPDADGDGLIAGGKGGLDPDDSTWDADGDGLSDTYELEQRQAGLAYSPTQCDTDGDGLTDRQEAQFGTAPDRDDSDLDGLLDGEEVIHEKYNSNCSDVEGVEGGWLVQLPSRQIRVQSNPLMVDSDGDGVRDADERLYAQTSGLSRDLNSHPFHPTVANVPYLSVVTEARPNMVRPETSLVYTTTVVTNVMLDPSEMELILPPDVMSDVTTYTLPFDPITFTGTQTVTVPSMLNVLLTDESRSAEIQSRVTGEVAEGSVITTTDIITVTGSAAIRIDPVAPQSHIESLGLGDEHYVQGSDGSPVTLIIGGKAGDTLTGIDRVEININGSDAWLLTDGAETWTYPLTVGDGSLSLRTRATDGAGNVETDLETHLVHADGRPPVFTFQNTPTQPVVPGRDASGGWTVMLGGSISDPNLLDGSGQGSGVEEDSLLVRLRSSSNETPVTGEWLTATLESNVWSLVYRFPASVADPTGVWVAEMRAADTVGNTRQAENPAPLYLDSAAPTASLSAQDVARSVMTGTLTIGGVISDTLSGIDRLDVSFTPLEQVAPLSDAVLWLSFDEQANSAYWADRSGHGNDASCLALDSETCPFSGQAGRIGGGLTLAQGEHRGDVLVADTAELNYSAGTGFSVQAWFKSDSLTYGNILYKYHAYGLFGTRENEETKAFWWLYDQEFYNLEGGPNLTDGEWYHIVGTFDPRLGEDSGKMQLFVNGELVGETYEVPNVLPFSPAEPLKLGGNYFLDGMADEVIFFQRALSADEVRALYQAGTRPWYPASLSQHGSGVTQATWSVAVPEGLEGIYQIDLRGMDVLGNTRISAKAWRGAIDTRSPRLVLTTESTGAAYIDPTTTEKRVGVRHVCSAYDTYLDESSFRCPGSNLPPPRRSFDEDPILQSLFPDLPLRSGLTISSTQWLPPGVYQPLVRACDVFGNCSDETREILVDVPLMLGPSAAVVSPTDQAMIGSDGTINVTVAANAPESLQTVTLALDGTIVNTANFDQDDAVVFNQRVVPVSAFEGPHTLLALASDWAGNTQSGGFPVQFTLDTHPPEVGISTTLITENDVYHKGSPMLRFHGTASDTVCLATVQLSVGSGPFVDVNFDTNLNNAEWSVAYFVNAPEGQTLTATARATDCAGQTTEIWKNIETDLTSDVLLDTRITSTPTDPSGPDNATFEFHAIKGNKEVIGLMCRLDDELYTPCASPHTYNDLNEGQHTFFVRAINEEGSVDASPASFTWTVNPEEQGSVLWLPLILRSEPYSDVVRNGSFESRLGWILQATDYPAIYSRSKTFSGDWSMRTGIENPNHNVHGYSGIWQQVILPRNIKSAVLSFWLYPFSTEDGSFNPTPFSLDPRQDNESIMEMKLESTSDTQWVLILDKHGDVLDMLVEQRSNKGMWEQWVIDLTKYQGQTFRLYFGTFNNGDGGVSGMYVDDVSLKVYR